MSFETIRINELAKELGLTSKEVIEKFAQLSITGKTHSSTVTVDQVKKLKDFINAGGVKEVKKPKAFVVKKAKTAEPEVKDEIKQEEPKAEVKQSSAPKVEVVKPKPQSRLEIVRRAPQKPAGEAAGERRNNSERRFPPRTDRPQRGDRPQYGDRQQRGDRPQYGDKSPRTDRPQNGDRPQRPFTPRRDGAPAGKKPFEKPSTGTGERKPIQRTIISQEIYDNKGPSRKRTGPEVKKKEKTLILKKKNRKEFL